MFYCIYFKFYLTSAIFWNILLCLNLSSLILKYLNDFNYFYCKKRTFWPEKWEGFLLLYIFCKLYIQICSIYYTYWCHDLLIYQQFNYLSLSIAVRNPNPPNASETTVNNISKTYLLILFVFYFALVKSIFSFFLTKHT